MESLITYKTLKLPSSPDWTTNEADDTLLQDLTVTFRPELVKAAQAALADNPAFLAINIDASVDGETDGKLKEVFLSVTAHQITCVIENEWTGTLWKYHITDLNFTGTQEVLN